jgi:nitroimidazol reductase NimA-like FMN-containing flavoprotein (pyridoxamine 5'-phosphate oxidase superfamily)
VRRIPERGVYDPAIVGAILDEALIVHVAWVDDDGSPRQIPTLHARVGGTLYVHGSRASQTMRALRDGAEVCITATIVDELVLARSLFHHSMNYRSVVLYGRAREVTNRDEFDAMSRALADHVAPGRGADARLPNEDEFRQTLILAIPFDEASAKIRTGPPKDDDADLGLPVWAGTLPLHLTASTPEADPMLADGIAVPGYLTDYRRPTA